MNMFISFPAKRLKRERWKNRQCDDRLKCYMEIMNGKHMQHHDSGSLHYSEWKNWNSFEENPWLWALALDEGLNACCWWCSDVKNAKSCSTDSTYAKQKRTLFLRVISLITFISTEQPWNRSVFFFFKDGHLRSVRRQSVSAYCNHLLQEKWHVPIRHPLGTRPLLSKHLLEWTSGPRGYLMNTNLLAA